jgi:cytoskeleton protein RodZ
MEQREAAKAMGVSLTTLRALEEGDFQRIGASILVQGHLSRYAQLLGLPEQVIIDRYEDALASELASLPATRAATARPRTSAARWLKWASYGLIPVVLIGLSWLSLERLPNNGLGPAQESVTPTAEPSAEDQVAELISPESTPVEGKVAQNPDPAPAKTITVPPAAEVGSTPELEQAPAEDAEAGVQDETDAQAATIFPPAEVEPSGDDVSTDFEAVETETPAPEIVGAPEPATPAPIAAPAPLAEQPPGMSELVLRFSEDCWLEVRDAEGNRLAYGLARAGTTRTLSGLAPFSLVLGYAPGVEIELDGSLVDRSIYLPARGAVSRFSLGESGGSG